MKKPLDSFLPSHFVPGNHYESSELQSVLQGFRRLKSYFEAGVYFELLYESQDSYFWICTRRATDPHGHYLCLGINPHQLNGPAPSHFLDLVEYAKPTADELSNASWLFPFVAEAYIATTCLSSAVASFPPSDAAIVGRALNHLFDEN